jgi:erythromycin esterase-like protein
MSAGLSALDPSATEAVEALRRSSRPLPNPSLSWTAAEFDQFGDSRIVLLGEATHGSSEFYRARAAITRRLIERHSFTIVAVEADWPDAATIDAYVRRGRPLVPAFARFPNWMWRNRDVEAFVAWLRAYNDGVPPQRQVAFRGLDVYSLGASIRAVLDFLDTVDPEAAKEARERYGCLTPWQDDPAAYGRAAMSGRADCEQQAVEQLRDLLEHRLGSIGRDGEAFLDAVQNAHIVRAAEQYYRAMYRGGHDAWNVRDRHMFQTLQHVLAAQGPDAKAVVWAHNSHIGNAAATEMGWDGEFNIGELCRMAYGMEAVLIGFGTDRGTVAAAHAWDEPMQIMTVRPARADSYEALFRAAGPACSLTEWRQPGARELREALAGPRLERAIGVIYRPESERASHYFQAVLPEQFDAFVWYEETSAVTPSAVPQPAGPEQEALQDR